ncbi:MAG TPA: Ig domain-containing protein, partial [Candidatus Dormibacteraeota bacterium]
MAISSFAFHSGEVGLSYSAVTLGATGGLPPYSWSLAGGSLPPGLSLSAGGVLSGNNTTSGSFSFTVKVSDSGGGAVTKAGAITVYSALTMTQPCVGQCVIGKGCTKCGVFGTVSRGLGPYTYRIVGGAVPP